MKTLLYVLVLTLLGNVLWQEKTEQFAGITCLTAQDVATISRVGPSYSLASTIERQTRCRFVVFDGVRVGETDDFSIGGTLYSFIEVDYEGLTVYVLNEKGEGWAA